jgi:flagellar hook protein FlgE
MLDIMTKAKDAIKAYNTALQVYSSNISNMSVAGYKRLDISFQSIFEKLLHGGTAADVFGGSGGTNPMQIGQGTAIGSVKIDFTQGSFSSAGYMDLGISGQGLFMVSPDDGETMLYTRSGKFHIDNDGYLRTETGMMVYGYPVSGGAVSGGVEPIRISSWVNKNLVSWTQDGMISLFPEATDGISGLGYPDTTSDPASNSANRFYQISLTFFNNPTGLKQAKGTTLEETLASGEPQGYAPPGYGPGGRVFPRQLEQSNVFYLEETINSLEIQRAMSGNLTVVRMASDIISQFINRLS